MRVIAGTARGHKLVTPSGLKTRPTTDRYKENLFNILSPDLVGTHFLDLFCGSGAIGVEALSRGANEAVFVDASHAAAEAVRLNLQKTKLAERAIVYHASVEPTLRKLSEQGKTFDVAFMDPPYGGSWVIKTLASLASLSLLEINAWVIAEMDAQDDIPSSSAFELIKQKHYGHTQFIFYRFK